MFKKTVLFGAIFLLLAILLLLSGYGDDGHLRGKTEYSKDGKTYFGIINNNGGECGPLLFDGEVWKHGFKKIIPVSPGIHKVTCGADIEFQIPEGLIFKFDYWGP